MLLPLSSVLYIVAFFFSVLFYYFNVGKRVPQLTLSIAVAIYFIGVFVKAVSTKSFPFADVYGFYSLLGNFIILLLIAFSFVSVQISRFYALLSFSGFLLTLLALPSEPSPYKNVLFVLHIIAAATSYTGVFFGSLSSLLRMILEGKLKSKNISGFFLPINTLAFSERIFINLAFIMLTLTLVFGSFWTRNFLGKHWVNDPKLISTFLIWLYYAVVVHLNLLGTLKPKRISQLNLMGGFFTLLNLVLIRHEL